MIRHEVKVELGREPRNILDGTRDARLALRHQHPAHRALGGDRNAVLVIPHLQRWRRWHISSLQGSLIRRICGPFVRISQKGAEFAYEGVSRR